MSGMRKRRGEQWLWMVRGPYGLIPRLGISSFRTTFAKRLGKLPEGQHIVRVAVQVLENSAVARWGEIRDTKRERTTNI